MLRKVWMAFCGLLLFCAELPAESPLPLSKWKTVSGEKASLSPVEQDGVLRLDFDIVPGELTLSGHQVFYLGFADLLLKEPIRLSPETERVLHESILLLQKPTAEIKLRPLIRDAEGELFLYQTLPFPHLNSGGRSGWGRYMTPGFFAGEAGAATKDVFDVVGTPKNFRPDGSLEFLGFRLTLRRYTANNPAAEKKLPVRGSIALGDFSFSGRKIAYASPFAYADSFLKEKGEFLFSLQVQNRFQGRPLSELSRRLRFDPENLASRKQKVEFTLGPDDNYWMEYQIVRSDGTIAGGGSMRQQVRNNPDRTPVRYVDTKRAPGIGHLRINPDHRTCGVYTRPEPAEVELRVFPRGKKSLVVDWKLLAYEYPDLLDKGSIPLTFENDAFHSLKIVPKTSAQRDIYRLQLEVRDGKRIVDSRIYYFGFKTDFSRGHDRVGSLPDRREVKKRPYHRTTYIPRGVRTEREALAHFREYLAESSSLTPHVTVMMDLVDFEVLPGVFHFTLLDHFMDAAADAGCKITVRFAHADKHGANLYRWPKYSRQYGYDGMIAPGHPFYGAYAVTDPGTQKLWLDAYRALYLRYRNHTAFEGYYIMQPGGEWTVVDQPWNGTLTGYDSASEQGFREWLKERWSLAELNRRWKRNFRSWNEIFPPMPDFRSGMRPDLRMEWVDFQSFKASLNGLWMKRAVDSIRSYDDQRVTIAYGSPAVFARELGSRLDYAHNGGNHYAHDLGAYLDAWNKDRVGWITEPHHPHNWAAYGDPAKKGWVLDWSVWVMTAQAAGGGANLHIYYMPYKTLKLTDFYGGFRAFDAMEKFKPILNEVYEMELCSPEKEIAVYQDPATLYTKHRTTFHARLDDLKRWFELLEADSVPHETLVPEKLANYKLIVPNLLDEVLRLETLELYSRAVRGGARMILSANTGKFVPELGDEPFQLLKKFGIRPPESAYQRSGLRVTARAEAGNPLFAEGSEIRFQTGDSFHAQLNSRAVLREFWKYPYRWIPETDYFGFYPGVKPNGTVLARFADGGAALSLHRVGKGEVLVFWGTPDMSSGRLSGMMDRAAEWAGAANPWKKNPLRYFLEGRNRRLNRHYVMVYNEKPGTFTLPVPNLPNGKWFLDDPVSSMRLGCYDGEYVRRNGLELTWCEGFSPLKFIRMIPANEAHADWRDKYRIVPPQRKDANK